MKEKYDFSLEPGKMKTKWQRLQRQRVCNLCCHTIL